MKNTSGKKFKAKGIKTNLQLQIYTQYNEILIEALYFNLASLFLTKKIYDYCLTCVEKYFLWGNEVRKSTKDLHREEHPILDRFPTYVPFFSLDWLSEEESLLTKIIQNCCFLNWETLSVILSSKNSFDCHLHFFFFYLISEKEKKTKKWRFFPFYRFFKKFLIDGQVSLYSWDLKTNKKLGWKVQQGESFDETEDNFQNLFFIYFYKNNRNRRAFFDFHHVLTNLRKKCYLDEPTLFFLTTKFLFSKKIKDDVKFESSFSQSISFQKKKKKFGRKKDFFFNFTIKYSKNTNSLFFLILRKNLSKKKIRLDKLCSIKKNSFLLFSKSIKDFLDFYFIYKSIKNISILKDKKSHKFTLREQIFSYLSGMYPFCYNVFRFFAIFWLEINRKNKNANKCNQDKSILKLKNYLVSANVFFCV